MLNIKILGPGCANCYILEGLAVAAVQFLSSQQRKLLEGVEVNLEHLHEQSDFRKYPVLRTPGLVVNGELVVAGRLPNVVEIMKTFEEILTTETKTPPTKAKAAR